eukprot:m.29771 g.29771  ORF g.29771 m.29771 type:complete len:1290 (-) comp4631_c0_seq1:347-4216(-)
MDPFQVLKRVAAAHRIKLGAITLTAIGVALRHHHALSRKNRRSNDQTKDKKIKAYDPRKGGISAMWKLLWPRRLGSGRGGEGSTEIAGIVVLMLVRIYLMDLVSFYVGKLDGNMMTRNQAEFWRLWRSVVGVAAASTVHRNLYKYTEARLAVVWRKKLTDHVHQQYFESMAYYQVAQSAAVDGILSDPDDRITEDAKKIAVEMAHVVCEGLYASTAGVFFAWRLGRLYGVRYAIAPYLYLWTTFVLTSKAAPVNWGKVNGKLRELFAGFRSSVGRLFVHQEAIAAMKGAPAEEAVVRSRYKALVQHTKTVSNISAWHGLVNQLGFAHWLRSFVALFVIGPHVFYPVVTDLSSVENVALLRGTIGHEFVQFIQSMVAAGLTAQMGKQLQKVAGSAGRLNELLYTIKTLRTARENSQQVEAIDGDVIEFKDVEVATPTGVLLVEKLSFRLEKGQSLLLTGFNGAGKSSIFRCLGGLWPVKRGTIIKPGGSESGLHQKVFFLPQKPYNVLGTLQEQLTYPDQLDTAMTRDELVEILAEVGLVYLADRPGVLTEEVNWEEELSLGEKQRLAMARLYYHKPDYVVLDECTSACAGVMEHRLYNRCKEMGITVITISHRPALQAFHQRTLTIGIGEAGYTLEDISAETSQRMLDSSTTRTHGSDGNTMTGRPAPGTQTVSTTTTSREGQGTVVSSVSSVSAPHVNTTTTTTTTSASPPSSGTTLKKLTRLLSLVLSQQTSLLAGGIVASLLVQSMITVRLSSIGGRMMGSVFQQDRRGFMQLVKESFGFMGALSVVEQAVFYLQRELDLNIRNGLTSSFISRLFAHDNYYRLLQFDGSISDPEQRMVDDVRDLSSTASQLFSEVLKPVLELSLFAGKLMSLVGGKATALLGLYLLAGGAAIRASLPNYRAIVEAETAQEARFKHAHERVRTHAESIAFFGGDHREHMLAEKEFHGVLGLEFSRLRANFFFGLVSHAIVREAPMIVQWLLRNSYGLSLGADAVERDNGVTINSGQLIIYEVTLMAFSSLSRLLEFIESFANLSGLIHRVSELDEALSRCEHQAVTAQSAGETHRASKDISFEHVDIVTPTHDVLAKGVTLQVAHGHKGLMVTGPNGSGKTAFFRVLGGLWPVTQGVIKAPISNDGRPNVDQVFLVPQRIYMAQGSLAQQIVYPLQVELTPDTTARLQQLLDLVGIGYLSSRYDDGWQAVMIWEDILSLGEQQRIGMARLFYHRPTFGVLDECTSAVSVEVEEALYREANARGITCITISQRLALEEFHAQELRMGEGPQGWSLHTI